MSLASVRHRLGRASVLVDEEEALIDRNDLEGLRARLAEVAAHFGDGGREELGHLLEPVPDRDRFEPSAARTLIVAWLATAVARIPSSRRTNFLGFARRDNRARGEDGNGQVLTLPALAPLPEPVQFEPRKRPRTVTPRRPITPADSGRVGDRPIPFADGSPAQMSEPVAVHVAEAAVPEEPEQPAEGGI